MLQPSLEMRKILTWLFTLWSFNAAVYAQSTKPVTGLSDERSLTYAFVHANIFIDHEQFMQDAVLLVRDGKVLAAGAGVLVPPGAQVYDMKGRYIYPSFIEPFSDYGQPEVKEVTRSGRRERGPQTESNTPGPVYWNQAIHPETDAFAVFNPDGKKAADFRKAGFGLALTGSRDGIARGCAALVLLGDESSGEMMIRERAAQLFSFNKGSSTQDYPSSQMGSVALLRQAYLDAKWYGNTPGADKNISLEAWNRNSTLPQVFEVSDYRSALRADRLGDEFGVQFIIKGKGDEYKRVAEMRNSGAVFILPLVFPKAYDMSNPFDALNVSLEDLRHWELAPANAALLYKNGVRFAFTTDGLKDKKELAAALQKLARYGIPQKDILKALTAIPAALYGVEGLVGALRPGMMANFFICSKDYFAKDNTMLEHWVKGKRYILRSSDTLDVTGKFALRADTLSGWTLQATGDPLSAEWSLTKDTLKLKVEAQQAGSQWTFRIEPVKGKGAWRFNGTFGEKAANISGQLLLPDGRWTTWTATRVGAMEIAPDSSKKTKELQVPEVWYPNMAFGWPSADSIPRPEAVLFQNITVWTCEDQGVLRDADVLIRDGKIVAVGKMSEVEKVRMSGVTVIDGTGLHLTPGLIDEHSHIAVSDGVNEGTQSITSEVRIGDVIDPDDINIYRQLAGGVTTSHLLHGSANAIGGQTALIKLRWGKSAEQMKFEGADGFIKFALGENVKQANWGDNNVTRYPQTRMGVEQIYMDAFTRARAYDLQWKKYNATRTKGLKSPAPRRDLELEALAEILNKQRFITCHSYQQGEINMLLHVADTFGFKVNTFTHILEGYKVADKMKRHGAGASSFSDWWAYKYEVVEAIPQNGAILHRSGITTAFNSDDAEMARRLNQEAAKAVKYGNVPEEEALKFVTLNPAKLLHIDQRVGSIRIGKDADLVVWNASPMSVAARPVMTFVDGCRYFDLERDRQARQGNERERQRITSRMGDDKSEGGSRQRPSTTLKQEYHCNDMEHLPYDDEN